METFEMKEGASAIIITDDDVQTILSKNGEDVATIGDLVAVAIANLLVEQDEAFMNSINGEIEKIVSMAQEENKEETDVEVKGE